MKSFKPAYVRSLSSFRKEAASAIKGHWCISMLILLLLALIMILPIAAAVFSISYIPMPAIEILPINDPWSAEALIGALTTIFCVIAASSLVSFLLSPIQIVAQNRLSIRLLNEEKISLRGLFPTLREWGKSLRVSILGFIYSAWPAFLGAAVLSTGFTYLTRSSSFSELTPEMLIGLGVVALLLYIALIIYSITRSISYMAAEYFLVLFPEDNARTLLKNSRRCMRGYKGRFFLLALSFIGWIILSSVIPALLQFLPAGIVHPNVIELVSSALTLLFSLPLAVYFNTSLAAYVLHLPIDR